MTEEPVVANPFAGYGYTTNAESGLLSAFSVNPLVGLFREKKKSSPKRTLFEPLARERMTEAVVAA